MKNLSTQNMDEYIQSILKNGSIEKEDAEIVFEYMKDMFVPFILLTVFGFSELSSQNTFDEKRTRKE